MNQDLKPSDFRQLCKEAKVTIHSSGYCPGYAQANVLVLPIEIADDFTGLCERNPVACPLLGKTILGNPGKLNKPDIINDDKFDLRTDLPKYRIFERGELVGESDDILNKWNIDKHVGFLIGCSFSFENALSIAGLTPKNVLLKRNVSMYKTTKLLNPSGIFVDVTYVVSMRPYKLSDLKKVRDITRPFRQTHGEPIDWGYDAIERLGIISIGNPEYGDFCPINEDEIPVFWGCGVTTQDASLKVAKTINGTIMAHSPGHMLVLDIKNSELNSFT